MVRRQSPLSRRRLLACGLGLAVGAATGCTISDPRVNNPSQPRVSPRPAPTTTSAKPTPRPSPPVAGSVAGVAREQALAGRAAGLVEQHPRGLGKRRRLVAAIRDNHLAHATALLSADPTARPTTSTPAARPTPLPNAPTTAAGLAKLVAAERSAAREHAERALAATGFRALVWASMAVAAGTAAQALGASPPPAAAPATAPRPLPQLTDTQAAAELVRQLHAVVYGYQLAIGQLKVGSGRHDDAVRRLRQHRVLRDALITRLLDAGAKVPVAEPAYVPTVRPRNPRTAGRLIRDLETRLAPFCGLWLAAAASAADRSRAYDALAATASTALRWGAPLLRWPGWER